MNSYFNVISTFSGCGGSSLGYQMAGGKILLAIEWDDHAVKTYQLNFPNTPVYHGDITKLSVNDILEKTGLKSGELDILDGSPPCQGFSTAGKRCFTDDRNQLFKEYIRLLQGLQPKVFVMENVSGMIKGKMKLIFRDILTELKGSGYNVKARLMNTMYYGVPQSRKRIIFIGIRNDLNILPSYPNPQSKPIFVKNVLENVNNKTFGIYKQNPSAQKVKKLIELLKPGQNLSNILGNSKGFNCIKLDWNKPSSTILKIISVSGLYGSLIHPLESRLLTIEELKRIHTYPDDFKMCGNYEQQGARIGNSVPPLFMKAIAEHIKINILNRIKS